MSLTPKDIAYRYMAFELEYINRLLATRDISQAKAKLMLYDSVSGAQQAAGAIVTIKTGIHKGKAWANVL